MRYNTTIIVEEMTGIDTTAAEIVIMTDRVIISVDDQETDVNVPHLVIIEETIVTIVPAVEEWTIVHAEDVAPVHAIATKTLYH